MKEITINSINNLKLKRPFVYISFLWLRQINNINSTIIIKICQKYIIRKIINIIINDIKTPQMKHSKVTK